MSGPPQDLSWSARAVAAAVGAPEPTPQQVEVIEAPLHPCLVVAGAGSGKTETMAARVVWLVANGLVRPEEVLGLTFTRKAAIELGERLARRLRAVRRAGLGTAAQGRDEALALPTVSTYHAYAGRLVAEHGLRVGIEPDARLLSQAACWQLASEVVESYRGDMTGLDQAVSTVVESVLAVAGELAEHLVEGEVARQFLDDLADRVAGLPGKDHRKPRAVGHRIAARLRDMAKIYPLVHRYQELKGQRDALDFADQMALAARLARDLPTVGLVERQRHRAVLLDEFQDTSEAQLVLLESLFAGHGMPVTAVGDPNQSIYGWRGASATTLSRFPQVFGDTGTPAPVLPLSTSWRNAVDLLVVANRAARPLRAAATVQVEQLHPRQGAGAGRIDAARLQTHEEEAAHVARWIATRWSAPDGGRTGTSAAVLCRNRAQFDTVVHALHRHHLSVEVVGLGGLLNAPEVVDLVALLTVAQDPTRGDALIRLLTGPVTRLGPADIDGLWAWAGRLAQSEDEGEPIVLSEALHSPPPPGWVDSRARGVGEPARARIVALGEVVDRVRSSVGLPLPDLLAQAERWLGLDLEVASDPDVPPVWGRAQLDALGEVATGYAVSSDRPTLGGFVDWLEAARTRERGLELAEVSVSREAVQVLTVHAAKGLEWDVVAVPGLAEGIFPSYTTRSRWEDGQWVVAEPQDPGWLSGPGALPYPLRGDADGLPTMPWASLTDTDHLAEAVEEHRTAGGRHKVQEERRLAYVAFTRAREEMLLTAPVWSSGTTPRVTSRFLTELVADPACPIQVGPWEPMPEADADGRAANPLLAEETVAAWPAAPEASRGTARDLVLAVLDSREGAGRVDDEDSEDGRAREIDLLIRERAEAARARASGSVPAPGHLSTSALVEFAADPAGFWRRLRRPVPSPPAVQARSGTAFHAWVEQHYSAATLLDMDDLPGSDDEGCGVEQDRLRANFLASSWAGRRPAAMEVAVETVLGGVPVRGRIDAVFADDDGHLTIVDWKTGAPGGTDDQRRRAVQLAAYRLAYARLADVPPVRVDAVFFYASTGETISPPLLGEEELEALARGLVDVERQVGSGASEET
jgi:DNA helicase-2/ATP-dependent DNA helicase PcrA